ncbi:hypothetical protein SAMN05216436_1381, partial [bacterium A37T11]
MKKNNYTLSALFCGLICLGLPACSKDGGPSDDNITYPLKVKATAMEEQGPVKLYTKDGEVTDEAVIAKFIADAEYFNAVFAPEESDTITFTTDSTAKLGEADYIYSIEKQSEGLFTFN